MAGYESIPQVTNTEQTAASSPTTTSLRAILVAECIGTAILVQIGTSANCGSVYLSDNAGMWEVAVVWVVAAVLALFATASISGGHLNPAITLAFAIVRPNDWSVAKVAHYMVAQVVGAMIGAFVNLIIFSHAIANLEESLGVTRGSPEAVVSASALTDYWSLSDNVGGVFHAFLLEAIGTGVLAFVVFSITNAKNTVPDAAIAPIVGLTIGAVVFGIGPFTNAGINPARDLGPRIAVFVAGWGLPAFTDWFIYVTAPFVGGPLGALLADKVLYADYN